MSVQIGPNHSNHFLRHESPYNFLEMKNAI
jgi:hypothetical protein